MSFFPELYFNVDNGYLEGLVRGLKAGVLSQADYLNLVQCETLEGGDIKQQRVSCIRASRHEMKN
uniref:ATPase H+ transporting V0 subunit D1 n=1 Tax=Rattus norvegicus TaxID=10116 RepID=A0A8I6AXG8_RAT